MKHRTWILAVLEFKPLILETKYQKINNKRQSIAMLIYLQLKMNFPRAGFPPSWVADEKNMFALHYRWPKEVTRSVNPKLELETSTRTHEMGRPIKVSRFSIFRQKKIKPLWHNRGKEMSLTPTNNATRSFASMTQVYLYMSRNNSHNGWTLTIRCFPPWAGLTGYVVSFESRCFEILNLVVVGGGEVR